MIEIMPSKELVGTHSWGFSVPKGATSMLLLIDRSSLVGFTATITWSMELSLNNGASWTGLGAAGIDLSVCNKAEASYIEPRLGQRASGSRRILPEPNNSRRVLRGTISATEPVSLRATVELT